VPGFVGVGLGGVAFVGVGLGGVGFFAVDVVGVARGAAFGAVFDFAGAVIASGRVSARAGATSSGAAGCDAAAGLGGGGGLGSTTPTARWPGGAATRLTAYTGGIGGVAGPRQ
jgi:hypothetical protein